MKIKSIVLAVLGLAVGLGAYALVNSRDPLLVYDVQVIEIPKGPAYDIRPVVLSSEAQTQDFAQLMSRMGPYAAINGTFYSPECTPLGDVVTDGKVIIRGHYPNALAVTSRGKLAFVRRRGGRFDWSGYRSALAAGPMLLRNGKVALNPTADGFKPASLRIEASRSGVGLTKDGGLLLVVARKPVKLSEFANIMRYLGAKEAMNLDGGPACALYYRGKTLVEPRIRMTNLLVVDRYGE